MRCPCEHSCLGRLVRDSDRELVDEAEVFRVLRQHRSEIAMKRHVVAHQYSVTYGEGEAHGLVVGVSDAD